MSGARKRLRMPELWGHLFVAGVCFLVAAYLIMDLALRAMAELGGQ